MYIKITNTVYDFRNKKYISRAYLTLATMTLPAAAPGPLLHTFSLLGMHPSRLRFIVLDSDATFLVRHRLAVIVQLDIACLEALHVALFDERLLGAHQSTHRQCRARGNLATGAAVAVRTVHQLGLSTEADLARRLVPRCFPKVKSAMCV
jgi:hypothetical protein